MSQPKPRPLLSEPISPFYPAPSGLGREKENRGFGIPSRAAHEWLQLSADVVALGSLVERDEGRQRVAKILGSVERGQRHAYLAKFSRRPVHACKMNLDRIVAIAHRHRGAEPQGGFSMNIDIAKLNAVVAAALPTQIAAQQEKRDNVSQVASLAGLDLPGKVQNVEADFCKLWPQVRPFMDLALKGLGWIFPGKVALAKAALDGVDHIAAQICAPKT